MDGDCRKIINYILPLFTLLSLINCKTQISSKKDNLVSLVILNDKISLFSDTVFYEIKNFSTESILMFKPDTYTFRTFETYRSENPFRFVGQVFNTYGKIVEPNIWQLNISSNTLQKYLEVSKEEEKMNNYFLSQSDTIVEDTILYLQKNYLSKRLLILRPNETYKGFIKLNLWEDSRDYYPAEDESYFAISKDSLVEFRLALIPENFNLEKFLSKELLYSIENKRIQIFKDSLISNKVKIDTLKK
ncbi:MAG: hypothetical protein Q4G27_00405 [Flavobacteriaceae bacterium]|nr:hypothetical protein [Flavobacteriaceae bacterium]